MPPKLCDLLLDLPLVLSQLVKNYGGVRVIGAEFQNRLDLEIRDIHVCRGNDVE